MTYNNKVNLRIFYVLYNPSSWEKKNCFKQYSNEKARRVEGVVMLFRATKTCYWYNEKIELVFGEGSNTLSVSIAFVYSLQLSISFKVT